MLAIVHELNFYISILSKKSAAAIVQIHYKFSTTYKMSSHLNNIDHLKLQEDVLLQERCTYRPNKKEKFDGLILITTSALRFKEFNFNKIM